MLSDPGVHNILIAHMLLEDWTDPLTQCTRAVAKHPGPIRLSTAVSYRLSGPGGAPNAAGCALAAQLSTPGGHVVLPVLLAASEELHIQDFSTGAWACGRQSFGRLQLHIRRV